ncbi:hypothetical protein FNH22_02065 [Fulvivirga sp. M361]|uniref:hypothetical protein n=1 Tax=Fulvivirga sp. M361 TaxID=2594266 RepID=UPI001179EE72|nr:hypothetical protein [Fulvivirga sp. M361]TRX62127.1 hypothetical protein FNH22_02065 [Fulvivirga sp. M361]
MENFVDIGLWVAYILVFIAIVSAVVLPIVNSLGDPKSLVKPLLAIVGIGVLFLISWSMAGDAVNARAVVAGVSGSVSKAVGGALITMYILFIAALVGIVFTEINKAFK